MCGFTGFYSKNTDITRAELRALCKNMTDTLNHRGPDGSGIWLDPDLPLALGHRRLSIIDLSENGAQPMVSYSERYVISFNGEIYNFLTLQKELEDAGVRFKGRSDTEVLLNAVEYWGLNLTLQKLNGMFAFALWDRKERELHIARDRMGKKPVYIGWAGNDLIFGSELKALRAHTDFDAKIDNEALQLFLQYSCVPAPHCIYQGVWALPAGFVFTMHTEHLEAKCDLQPLMKPYWQHLNSLKESREVRSMASDEDTIDAFEGLLEQCVKDRMISDVPLGAFLSGGIDSSAVVALMQKNSSTPIKTYSIGFSEQGFNEAEHAKSVAAHLGTDHHELYLSQQDALDILPMMAEMYDEPFGDISAIPTYLVSRFAREDVTVALSGDGGDEMLGGYNRHIKSPEIWQKKRTLPLFINNALAVFIQKIPVKTWDMLGGRYPQLGTRLHKASLILGSHSEEDIYTNLLSAWSSPPTKNKTEKIKTMRHQNEWLVDGSYLDLAEKMMYWDVLEYLPNDILTKVDRASMAVGLEARAPLLDKRIYDFAWRLPPNQKIRDGQGKWLLRQVLYRHVPQAMIDRPKQGFTMPVGDWMRGELKDWSDNLLSAQKLEQHGLLDGSAIRKIWEAHQRGEGDHAQKLWNILMFQSWAERWM